MTNNDNDTTTITTNPEEVITNYDLSQFVAERILSGNSNRKTICILGNFKNLPKDKQAIIILEKSVFEEKQILAVAEDEKNFFQFVTSLKNLFVNDIYGNFTLEVDPSVNKLKATIIYPASEKHILKYSIQNLYIIEETANQYKEITEPYLTKGQFSLDWCYNILQHKQEQDRIVFEDSDKTNGFILLPDLKWDGKTKETLYLIAIVHRRDIRTLRDLTSDHLELLKNIQEKGIQTIEEKYNINKSQLRVYVHYQPSFFHFHVHFTYLKFDAPGINCERSHLLSTIISNIELVRDYYQKATLSFTVRETDHLYEKYEEILKSNKNSNCNNKKLRTD